MDSTCNVAMTDMDLDDVDEEAPPIPAETVEHSAEGEAIETQLRDDADVGDVGVFKSCHSSFAKQ